MEAAITSSCAIMEVAKLSDKQKEVITSFVECNNVLVVLPTGYRKSLCFALVYSTTCAAKTDIEL